MLITVSEQCDQKIMAIRDEEKQGNVIVIKIAYSLEEPVPVQIRQSL